MVRINTVFNLEGINLAQTKDVKGAVMSNITMFVNITRNLIGNYAQVGRGLTYEEQRIYGKLIFMLVKAEKEKTTASIVLEDSWYDFLLKTTKTKMMPGELMSRYFDLIEGKLPEKEKSA